MRPRRPDLQKSKPAVFFNIDFSLYQKFILTFQKLKSYCKKFFPFV